MTAELSNVDEISLMFEAARSFIGGAKIIIVSEGIEENGLIRTPTLPVIICAAIAVEIELKAILKLQGISRPKGDGHDLDVLFCSLPAEHQRGLLEFQLTYTGMSPDAARVALTEVRNVFKEWRYAYEHSTLATAPGFLYHFALALSEYIKVNASIERSENGWRHVSGDSPGSPISHPRQ